MSATRHTVTEPKPPFWSRPRVFIGVCVAIVSGLGSALYTQDNVKSAATLVTTAQQPAAQIRAHKDYLEVEPIATATPEPDRSLELWAMPEGRAPVSLGCYRRMARALSASTRASRKAFASRLSCW